MRNFKLSEIQANAILDMPLRRLAALERKKIELEYKEMKKLIKQLEGLLKSPKKMRDTVGDELIQVKEKFGERRRTRIVRTNGEVSKRDLLTARDIIPDENIWVIVDADGLISRTPAGKSPRLWGRAAPRLVLKGNTRDTLYLVAEDGQAAAVAVHSLPIAELADQGVLYYKITPLGEKHKPAALFCLPSVVADCEEKYLLTFSKGGMVKKSEITELPGPSSQPFTIAKVKQGDCIGWTALSSGQDELLIGTAGGMAIHFKEDNVRAMGLASAGVNAIKLKSNDYVIGALVLNKKYEVFMLASDGNAKRVKISKFPIQNRYGLGVSAWKLESDLKLIALANDKPNREITIHLKRAAAKKTRLDAAPIRSRQTSGKQVVEVKEKDNIVAVTIPWEAPF